MNPWILQKFTFHFLLYLQSTFLIKLYQIEGSPEWQAYKNAELAFIAPSVGPTPINYAQSELNFVGPAPGPLAPVDNYAQAQLNYQQQALNFIASGAGR